MEEHKAQANESIVQIISDLVKLRDTFEHEFSGKTPEIVLAYLLANRGLMTFSLKETYEKRSEDFRKKLYEERYPELDESGIDGDFLKIAETALLHLGNHYRGLVKLDYDHLHMLIRGLKYAKYCVTSKDRFRVLLHPIEQYLP